MLLRLSSASDAANNARSSSDTAKASDGHATTPPRSIADWSVTSADRPCQSASVAVVIGVTASMSSIDGSAGHLQDGLVLGGGHRRDRQPVAALQDDHRLERLRLA